MSDDYPEPDDSDAPLAETLVGTIATAVLAYSIWVGEHTLALFAMFTLLVVVGVRAAARGDI
jgi:hypothetical protein